MYDVFLSYNSKNRPEAQVLAQALKSHGLSVFWDREYLRAGKRWIPALEEALESSKAFVVLNGPEGLGRWQRIEVEVALDRQAEEIEVLVIPALLPRALPLPRFLKLNTWVDLRKGTDDPEAIDILLASLGGNVSPVDRQSQTQAVRALICPYRGLSSFREDDAEYFCGRDLIVQQLATTLRKSRFVAMVGPSGSGKSSVVHAGLVPHLRKSGKDQFWDFAFMRPADKPLRSLVASIFPLLDPGTSGSLRTERIQSLTEKLAAGTLDLADLIMDARVKKPGVGCLLLVVDQWEELYTQCRDERAHTRFVAQLHDAMGKGLLSVVGTLRSDFVSRTLDEADLRDRLDGALVYLRRMHTEELRCAVEEPAKRVGLEFQPGLVDRICDDLGEEPGHLPLLEFVLTELWKRRQGMLMRHSDYEELGGGRKALASRAEDIFNRMGEDDQTEVRRLFLQLVRPGEGTQDTRRRIDIAEIGEEGKRVMQPLVAARLLTTHFDLEDADDSDNPEGLEESAGTIEITHEALIGHWARLSKWLDQEREFLLWRERLRSDRSAWEEGERQAGFLLTRAPLAEAEEWLRKRRDDLNQAELDFIKQSLESRGREEAQRDRLRKVLVFSLAGLALIFLSLALFGLWRWRLSLSRALAAEAIQLQNGPLDVALLLGVEAGNVHDTLEARGSLLSLLEQSQELQAFLPGHKGRVSRVAFSPDGRRFATAGTDEIFLWDAETGQRIDSPFRGHAGPVLDLAFSPDGLVLASCGKDKTIRLWRIGDHQLLRSPIDIGEPVRNLGFSPDGKLLVASQAGSILLWDYPSLQARDKIEAHKVSISRLAFRSDGLLAASSYDGTISLWRLDRREKVRSLSGHNGQVLDIAFSPDGRTLASGGWDKTIRLWDSETGDQLGDPIAAHRDAILSVAFSRDGKTLASAGLDKVIRLWAVANGLFENSSRPAKTLFGHGKAVWTLAFGDAGHLASGGDEASAILWNITARPRFAVSPPGISGEVDSVAFSPDGGLFAAGGNDGVIRLWDTFSEQMRVPALQGHRGAVYGLAFRNRRLFSGGEDGRILIWDLDHPQNPPQELKEGDGKSSPPVSSLALSLDGKTVASGNEQGRVRLWAVDPPQFLGEMKEHDRGAVLGLSFSPDGRLLAAGGAEGLIRIWDVSSRRLVRDPLKGHDTTVTGLAFDPAGRILASASADRTVQLWDVKTWKPLAGSPLTGPEDLLTAIAFSPKGDRLATSVLDGTVFLWDVDHRLPIGSGLRGAGKALNIAFHPNGKCLAVGSENSALLFDLRYGVWRDEACRIVGRNLTSQEWSKYLPYEPYRQTCSPEK